MAKVYGGPLGTLSGKVGNYVFALNHGRQVVRRCPGQRKDAASIAQVNQQEKFKTASAFVNAFDGLANISFKLRRPAMPAHSYAMQSALSNVIRAANNEFTIDYPNVVMAKGRLGNVQQPGAVSFNGNILFLWKDNAGSYDRLPVDRVLMIIYIPDLKVGIYDDDNAIRTDETFSMDLNQYRGHTAHAWIATVSADRRHASNSQYVGEILISDNNRAAPKAKGKSTRKR